MSPKEKAKELYDTYNFVYIQNYTSAHEVKQCALIAVEEIIKEVVNRKVPIYNYDKALDYWEEVIKELEKL